MKMMARFPYVLSSCRESSTDPLALAPILNVNNGNSL